MNRNTTKVFTERGLYMYGKCLNCEEDTEVFECPVCGEAHDLSKNFEREYCDSDHCVNQ